MVRFLEPIACVKLMNRMSAMQKMQAAAGGKPLGPNGQPSPAQIEAMRVSFSVRTTLKQADEYRKRCHLR